MKKLTKLKWDLWDLDGCLATQNDPYQQGIGKPIRENVNLLLQAHAEGHKIIIYTARHWDNYPIIEEWLIKHKIPFKMIICGKVLAGRMVDDKAYNPFCLECKKRYTDGQKPI